MPGRLLVAVAVLLGACSSSGSERAVAPTTSRPPTEAQLERAAGWERLDRHSRGRGQILWNGRYLLRFGQVVKEEARFRFPAEGDRFDPLAGTWREMRPPPLPRDVGLKDPTLAAAGHGPVVVTGDPCRSVGFDPASYDAEDALTGPCAAEPLAFLAYDPALDRWRRLPSPPVEPLGAAYPEGWDGGRVIYELIFRRIRPRPPSQRWALDPASGRWQRVPDPPLQENTTCQAGDRFVVADRTPRDPADATRAARRISLLDPRTNRWSAPTGPVEPRIRASASLELWCSATTVVLVGPSIPLSSYDLDARRWRPIPRPAGVQRNPEELDPFVPAYGVASSNGDVVLGGRQGIAIFDHRTQRWQIHPLDDDQVYVLGAVGRRILTFSSDVLRSVLV